MDFCQDLFKILRLLICTDGTLRNFYLYGKFRISKLLAPAHNLIYQMVVGSLDFFFKSYVVFASTVLLYKLPRLCQIRETDTFHK